MRGRDARFESHFFPTAVSKCSIISHWQFVIDRQRKSVLWLITKLFVIKQGLFFLYALWSITNLSVIVMWECFVNNCGNRWLCDACLWLITEVYDKSQKPSIVITKKVSVQNSVINCGKCPSFLKQCGAKHY